MVKILTSTIQHELGHGFGAWTLGFSTYNAMASFYRENWAIWYTNSSYRVENALPNRFYQNGPWYDYFGWFHKGHNP